LTSSRPFNLIFERILEWTPNHKKAEIKALQHSGRERFCATFTTSYTDNLISMACFPSCNVNQRFKLFFRFLPFRAIPQEKLKFSSIDPFK
jgi:hypothetical protein